MFIICSSPIRSSLSFPLFVHAYQNFAGNSSDKKRKSIFFIQSEVFVFWTSLPTHTPWKPIRVCICLSFQVNEHGGTLMKMKKNKCKCVNEFVSSYIFFAHFRVLLVHRRSCHPCRLHSSARNILINIYVIAVATPAHIRAACSFHQFARQSSKLRTRRKKQVDSSSVTEGRFENLQKNQTKWITRRRQTSSEER